MIGGEKVSTLYNHLDIFMVNIFFVFILFFIYHQFIEKRISQVTQQILIGLISGISIIMCMTFPLNPVPGFIFDMRQVPFIVGALYGGRKVALFLLIVLLSYRYSISIDDGFYSSVIIFTLLFIGLCYIFPRFMKTSSITKKVIIAMLASMSGFLLLLIVVYSFNPSIDIEYFFVLVLLYSIQYIGIGLFVYIIEKTRRDLLLLEEIRKLEKLKIVSEIAASISHEVRNPLTVTRGFIQLLRDSNLTEEQKSLYISFSINELDRAEHIITDYLTFAKPALENIDFLELGQELHYVIMILTPYATMKNVSIELKKEKGIHVIGEASKLHQCFINIIKNGIEAMDSGGTLTIELLKREEKAVIKVEDTGKGMSPEQINRLGTPYYSTKDKGTGLGTMVVYSIIKLLGGEIVVDSVIEKGTCFTITLPLVDPSKSTIIAEKMNLSQ